jgi:GT2 family glycosyltransferase
MSQPGAQAQTTVVVPIHNASAALRLCLDALLQHTAEDVPILLIDDASTDPEVAPLLQAASADPRVRVLRNPHNLGFVRTCNRAFAETDSNVLLLNSDALVTPNWLAAILRAACSQSRVASVTPWSNNAEICSIPQFCSANPVPTDAGQWAWAVAQGTPSYPALPTAIGFCMWVSRQALAQIGDFDAATFGRGYGEENDWCCRASGFGYTHLLCDDAYVVHLGGQSFGPLGEKPGGTALARLSARYPHYTASVASFIQRDPLAERRQQILTHLPDLRP